VLYFIRHSHFTSEFRVLASRILSALLIVTIVIIVEGVAFWFVSKGTNTTVVTPGDGIYFIVVSIFGETSAPTSLGARVVTIVALVQGLILATYLIAVSAYFTIRGGRFMTRDHKNHYIICGWNFQASRIIQELLNARKKQQFDIVVMPGEETNEQLKEFGNKVFVVMGSPTDDRTLMAADIKEAKSVIILSDTTLEPNNSDARALMITLAVETLNPSAYTCVQLMNSENEVHLMRANADETVPFDVLGANLSVASALAPGITKVVNELVHFDEGSELYKISPPLPRGLEGLSFKEASVWFTERDMILVGVESDELRDSYKGRVEKGGRLASELPKGRGVSVNPIDHRIKGDDALFVISHDDPEL
jgi:voltage-gated potassium channel